MGVESCWWAFLIRFLPLKLNTDRSMQHRYALAASACTPGQESLRIQEAALCSMRMQSQPAACPLKAYR